MTSPCNGICVLDPTTGWCRGCLRTIEEITLWRTMTEAERQAVVAEQPAREARLLAPRNG